MILRYTPTGGVPQVWDLSTVRFLTSEAETLERTTNVDWDDLCGRRLLVVKKSPTARRAIVWVLLKRNDPALRYARFDPAVSEIDVKLGADDVAELRAEIETERAKGTLSEDEVEQGWADLEAMTDPDVLAAEAAAAPGQDGPKEPAATPAEPWQEQPVPATPRADSAPAASPTSA